MVRYLQSNSGIKLSSGVCVSRYFGFVIPTRVTLSYVIEENTFWMRIYPPLQPVKAEFPPQSQQLWMRGGHKQTPSEGLVVPSRSICRQTSSSLTTLDLSTHHLFLRWLKPLAFVVDKKLHFTKSALDQMDWIEKITDVAMVQANQAKHFNNQYGKRQMMQIGFLPRTKSWTKV
ncbi:hypothetical protein P8452_22976 [Trifolium repens]|nr:hypothetical protein P8452_22976 [Trifolium repens]